MELLSKLHAMKRYWRLFLFFLLFSAKGWSQNITLSVDRQPLEKVFLLIEKQSGYNFIYSSEAMEQSKPVSFEVNNETLANVLAVCFKDQPLKYTTTADKHVIVKLKLEKPVSSNREVKGKVVNENGKPVAGVTILIKKANLFAVSDDNGDFGFANAPDNVVLVISGAELEARELFIGNQSFVVINVKAKLGTLDETVVIAYGRTNKRVSTGTIGRVSKEEINKQPVSNPLSVLAGRVSGIQVTPLSGAPGTHMIVQIRGRNSIANGNDPLFIVDGVPFPSTTLNNNTGGVGTRSSPLDNLNPSDIESIEILKDADATAIFGSRGANGVILISTKKGRPGKTQFSVRSYKGIGTLTRRMDLLSTPDYITMRREAFSNDAVTPTLFNAPDLLLWDTTRHADWQKELIGKTVHTNDINITLSGGSEQTQFLLGAGYHKETTVFPGPFGSEKMNGNFTINHRSADGRLSVSFSGSFLVNKNTLPREDLSQRITLSPNAPAIYKPDGSLNWESSSWTNPMAALQRSFENRTQNLSGSLSLSYKLPRQVEMKLTAGYSHLYLREHGVSPRSSFDPAKAAISSAVFGNSTVQTLIAEPQVTHLLQCGNHQLESLLGLTVQQTEKSGIQQTGSGYASDNLLNSLKAAASVTTNSETDSRYRYSGLFGRLAYSYAKKYLATVTLRRDGSSRFGPANRFATFSSLGVGWIFTKEDFFKKQKVLSFGKVKGSFGKTGNDQIGDYRYLDLYAPYSYTYQSVVPFYPTQLFNPSYGWEEVKKLECSVDLGFFKDRLLLTANYYYNRTGNQLINYPLATTTGYAGILRNLPATIRNSGIELEVNAVIIKKRNFTWSTGFNISFPKNRLVRFDDLGKSSFATVYEVGQPLSIIKRFTNTGVNPATGVYSFQDYNGDGILSSSLDEKSVLDGSQRFFGGLQQTVTAGNWSMSLLVQFVKQPYASSYLSRFPKPGALSNQPVWVKDRWRKEGDITAIQRYTVTNPSANIAYLYFQLSDAALSDASFIRLRNLYISYDLSSPRLEKAGCEKLLFFMQGHNLLTITKYKGLDPETQTFLPPVKLITAGVQVNF